MFRQRPNHQPLVAPGTMQTHDRDMTAVFAADVTLRAAQEQLRPLNQWLPIDGEPDATLGQLVLTNSTGPLRLGYGAWRDLILGVQFFNGDDELITAGGRTVKNVAGYDLSKFIVGSRGVFGRLVTITTRTYRRPAGAILGRFAPDPQRIIELMPTALRPQWAIMTRDALLLGYFGEERTLDYYTAKLPKLSPLELTPRSLDDDIAHRASLWKSGPWRASLPPSRLLDFARAAGLQDWVADAAYGNMRILDVSPDAAQLTRAAEQVGSVAWPETGSLAAIYGPAEIAILQRLKRAMDPNNRLAPLPL